VNSRGTPVRAECVSAASAKSPVAVSRGRLLIVAEPTAGAGERLVVPALHAHSAGEEAVPPPYVSIVAPDIWQK